MLDQFGAWHHAALMVDQIGEYAVFMGGQLDRSAIDCRARGPCVDPKAAGFQRSRRMPSRPAQQGAQASQQFFRIERLGQVIVRTGIEARHLFTPAVARRQDHHGEILAVIAPALEDRHAVHLGQAKIEDHRVIRFGVTEKVAILAISGQIDRIARLCQRIGELPAQICIVFNNQNSH